MWNKMLFLNHKKNWWKVSFKLFCIGDSGVGKTAILRRYVHSIFNDDSLSTIGVFYSYKEVTLNGKDKIKLKLIDTAGQEKYKALTKSYFKNVDGVLFVFALDDKITFNDVNEWIELFNANNSWWFLQKESIKIYFYKC